MNAGYLLNTVDVSGPYSGIAIGISNSLGSFSGILAPLVANNLTKNRTMEEWRLCFIVFSAVLFVAGLIFLLFSKGQLEHWARAEDVPNVDINEIKRVENTSIQMKSFNSYKLQRQYSIDRDGGIVPSNSIPEYDEPYNHVVVVPNYHMGKKQQNTQKL